MEGGFLDKCLSILTVVAVLASAGSVWVLPPGPSTGAAPTAQPPSESAIVRAPGVSTSPVLPASSPENPAPPASPAPSGAPMNAPASPPVSSPAPEGPVAAPTSPPEQTLMLASSQSPLRYHVQVGAFKYRKNAEDLLQQVRSQGFTGTLVEGPLFRVWVGQDLGRVDAEHLATDLQEAGFETFLSPWK
jgi:cell division protein FtsN